MKRKLKILKTERFAMLKMAEYFSLMISILDLVSLYFIALQKSVDFIYMISAEPLMNILFMIGMLMLVTGVYFRWVIKQLEAEKNIEGCIWHLIVLLVINVILLNYPAIVGVIWALAKYFNWQHVHLLDSWQHLLDKSERIMIILSLTVCLSLEGVLYLSIFASQNL